MKPGTVLGNAICAYADRVYGVPGYPVTGLIAETGADLVINEKVALEYALGDSLSGKRACVIVKNIGMNTLSDPLVHATVQGLSGGVVLVAGDDMAASGTQVILDSRLYGPVAIIPVLEMNRHDPVGEAFAASERYSRVALLRFCPDEQDLPLDEGFRPDTARGRGSLADPDLTMYGRAVHARSSLSSLEKSGYLPFPVPLPDQRIYPVKRSERGHSQTLCHDCPFRPVFSLLEEKQIAVIPDTGCSLLSMNPPYSSGKANYGLGSSVAVASRSTGIALTGDYALLHSGLQGLIDLQVKGYPLLCIVLQNRCMGMTGRQPVPDILDYIGFTRPVVCTADDHEVLNRMICPGEGLRVLVVQGTCPGNSSYETMAC
ncbi:MAG: thiamine pyrophosphate-dependent enzyme [Methanospirillum sp.]|nr:thiamine pyrophosphate-dependent enzyme [Methanospirillum sp.]